MRPFIAAVLLGLFVLTAGHAQSLQSGINDAGRRWTDYQEALESSDPVTRFEALRAALADQNVGIRSNALFLILRRREALPVEINLPTGSQIDFSDMPTVEVRQVNWDREQKSFQGRVYSRSRNSNTIGGVVDGTLRIRYYRLGIAPVFEQSESNRRSRRPVTQYDCSTVLALQPGQNALTGTLRCEGLSQPFPLRMPLG